MFEVEEFNALSELNRLRPAWSRLLADTPAADFFRTLAWLEVYWRHFGAGQRLRVLAVSQGATLAGILPLMVTTRRTRLGRFRVLEFPLDFWGSFYGPIGPRAEATLRAGLAHILATPRDWDYLDLRWLADAPHGARGMAAAAAGIEPDLLNRRDDAVAIADLSGGWDAYWSSRSANWRSNCRRNAKKTESAGRVEFVRHRPRGEREGDGDPRWDLYEQVLAIADTSWQGRSKDGTSMTHGDVRAFLRDLHATAAREGNLDLNLLAIDGKPVAFQYNYHYRGYVSSLRLGFDPAYASCGVGTVLTWRMLQDSCLRGDHTFDFLPGSLPVKRPWQTALVPSERFEYMPLCFGRVSLLRAKRWVSDHCGIAR
jgi:CelD/BcsL family acetyltransferase involved in cellulose biosynthesis